MSPYKNLDGRESSARAILSSFDYGCYFITVKVARARASARFSRPLDLSSCHLSLLIVIGRVGRCGTGSGRLGGEGGPVCWGVGVRVETRARARLSACVHTRRSGPKCACISTQRFYAQGVCVCERGWMCERVCLWGRSILGACRVMSESHRDSV